MSYQDSAVKEKIAAHGKYEVYVLKADAVVEEKKKANALVKALEEMRGQRLTLEQLQLTVNEQMALRSCDRAFRHALWKSGEHVCLTAIPECCRKTAVSIREYQRQLTLTEKNKIPKLDDTPFSQAEEKSKQYFTPKKV